MKRATGRFPLRASLQVGDHPARLARRRTALRRTHSHCIVVPSWCLGRRASGFRITFPCSTSESGCHPLTGRAVWPTFAPQQRRVLGGRRGGGE
eukprot:2956511-Pyramimonas_sp.AAC.1